MSNPFFDRPIVNSPYEYPRQHWELDETGQPTGHLIDRRRRAEFITPIPKPKKRRGSRQEELDLDEGKGLSTKKQAYDLTSIINEVRAQVDTWRNLPASQWQVTPETARLLQPLTRQMVQYRVLRASRRAKLSQDGVHILRHHADCRIMPITRWPSSIGPDSGRTDDIGSFVNAA